MNYPRRRIRNFFKHFERHGGEGEFTKIITDDNKDNYEAPLDNMENDEIPLVICKLNDRHWTLITSERVLIMDDGGYTFMYNADICKADWVEFDLTKYRLLKSEHTRINLIDRHTNEHMLIVEKGRAFFALLNGLMYIAHCENGLKDRDATIA